MENFATTEQIEANQHLAKFMGAKWNYQMELYQSYGWDYEACRPTKWSSRWWGAEQLEYHNNWEWLMPVIEKIEGLNDEIVTTCYVSINGRKCSIWNYFNIEDILRKSGETGKYQKEYTGKTKIEAVFNACAAFAKWHNEIKYPLSGQAAIEF